MATYNRLRRCISTASLFRSHRLHVLSSPNFSNARTSLLRPIHGLSPTPTIHAAGPLFSFSSRSIFTSSGEVVDLSGGDQPLLPLRALTWMLDEFHDFSSLPWWIIIGSSIVALRVALMPLLVVQLHKLKRIGELFPKLPSPIPPPRSGNSNIDQLLLFEEKRKEIGCPSPLWFLPYVCVQVPSFFLWMTTVRRMSLDQHTGFDSGGALWFHNLTEFPHGAFGCIFPVVIAGLHYTIIQISFRIPTGLKSTSLLLLILKCYKIYLDLLTLPILVICFYVPQGSLVYWATNSSLTVIQQLLLRNPFLLTKLGLLDTDPSSVAGSGSINAPAIPASSDQEVGTIHIEDLSLKDLISISLQLMSEQQIENAIYILQVALERDPDYTHALVLTGQALLMKGLPAEAMKYLEQAIFKLMASGFPSEEAIDHLILASMWMGSIYCQQGKIKEGLVHFERIGNLKEPNDPAIKPRYFDGLIQLSSALHAVGRREESLKYIRLAVAYNPACTKFLEQLEAEENPFAELANSRREDY